MNQGKLSDCGLVSIVSVNGRGEEVWTSAPCQWRGEGLAVVRAPEWLRLREGAVIYADCDGPAWGVTHLVSGRNIGPRHRTAAEALAVALGLTQLSIDWTQDMESVKKQVEANETAASFILALHHGRVAMVEAAKA